MGLEQRASEVNEADKFTRDAEQSRVCLAGEFWESLKHNKKSWLLPILIVIVLVGVLVALSGNGAAPFIRPPF